MKAQALIGGKLEGGGRPLGIAGAGLEAGAGSLLLPGRVARIDVLEDLAQPIAVAGASISLGKPGADAGAIRKHLGRFGRSLGQPQSNLLPIDVGRNPLLLGSGRHAAFKIIDQLLHAVRPLVGEDVFRSLREDRSHMHHERKCRGRRRLPKNAAVRAVGHCGHASLPLVRNYIRPGS